jgi:hypothetical protein
VLAEQPPGRLQDQLPPLGDGQSLCGLRRQVTDG